MSCARLALRKAAVSIVLGLSLVTPVIAQRPSQIRIENFGKVNEQYYRGAQPAGRDFADLKSLGVKLVIDLAREGDRYEASNVEAAGMRFVRIPLSTGDAPSNAAIDDFLKLVNDPANQPVYVHCMGGRHRTGALTAVYRMAHDGWNADRAFSEMKQYRFGADFLHPELKKFVYAYFSGLDKTRAPRILVATATPVVQ